ncbi:hypothetical protein [Enterococcus sp. 2201sp1_2201st1_C11_2201SCRN_220225]|uniref:hypothetical protein n=2 Tax=Enterococcus TaxID=1350 RepID=UPI0034A1EEDE
MTFPILGTAMPKRHRNLIALVTVLTFIRMVFASFYPFIYAYFNTQDLLSPFLLILQILRLLLYLLIFGCGLRAIADKANRALPFYLLLFFFNLITPFVFG